LSEFHSERSPSVLHRIWVTTPPNSWKVAETKRYDDRVKGRIGGIYARQKTRMGPALRVKSRSPAPASNSSRRAMTSSGRVYRRPWT
jgi:hypothetical protein